MVRICSLLSSINNAFCKKHEKQNIMGNYVIDLGVPFIMNNAQSEIDAQRNQKYWDIQTDKLHKLNEQSADNAQKRTLDLYFATQSPKAIKKQLLDAGLNPALMYSKSGMGGQISQGPQAQTSGGTGFANQTTQLDALTLAQISNIKADTKKKEEEANNISQDTKTKQAQEEYTKAKTLWTNIRTQIDNNNLTISNETIQEQITEIKTKTQSALEELENLKRNNDINEATYNEQINKIKQEYANSVSQGLIMAEEIEKLKAVTENTKWDKNKKQEEIKKIKWECRVMQQEVFNLINDTNLKYYQSLTEQEQQNYIRTLKENVTKEFEAKYGWTLTKEDAHRMGENVASLVESFASLSPTSLAGKALTKPIGKVGF